MTSPAPSEGPSRRRVAGLALLGVGVVAAIIGLASLALDGDDDGSTAAPPPTTATADPSAGATSTDGALPTDGTAPGAPVPGTPGTTSPTEGIAAPPGGAGAPTPGAPAPGAPAPGAPGADGAGSGDAGSGGADSGGAGAGGAGSGDAGSGGAGAGGAGSGDGRGAGSGGGDSQVSAVRSAVRVYNNSTIGGLAARAAEDFRTAGWPVEEVGNYPSGIIPTSTVYYRPGTNEKRSAETLGSEFSLRVEPRFEGLTDASPGVIVIVTNDYQRR